MEESVGALAELQRAGKIRDIGVCNVDEAQLARARAAAAIVSVQNRYSLVERGSRRRPRARASATGSPSSPGRRSAKGFLAHASGALADVAARHGATPGQVALAWVLRSPAAFAIPGTASIAHLEENMGAAGLVLTDEDVRDLDRASFYRYRARRLARKARARAGKAKAALRGDGR